MTLQQTGSGNVKGDPAMLRRALSNLLSNAVKYGNKNSTIRIKLQQNLDNTIFSIENEGLKSLLNNYPGYLIDFIEQMHLDKEQKKEPA